MQKKYSNKIVEKIVELGFSVSDFAKSEYKDNVYNITRIQYNDTPLNFEFAELPNSFDYFRYRHNLFDKKYTLTALSPSSGNLNFVRTLERFNYWIVHHVNRYIEEEKTPDLWEESNFEYEEFEFVDINFDENIAFTTKEKLQLNKGLDILFLELKEKYNLLDEKSKFVENEIKYLREAAERTNKIDWKNITITVLIKIIYDVAKENLDVNSLFLLLKSTVKIIQLAS